MSDATARARDLFFAALDHHNHYRYSQAEGLYREALVLVPDRVSVLVNLSAVLIAQEKFVDAREMSSRILAIEPDHPLAKEHLSLCAAADDPRRHDGAMDQRLADDPTNVALLVQRAALLREAGHTNEALQQLDEALSIDPDDIGALMNRAGIRSSMAHHDDAIDDYMAVLRRAPDLTAAGQGFIDCVLKTQSPPRIEREFDRLLVRAIGVPWASPQSIAPILIARLHLEPSIGALHQPLPKAMAASTPIKADVRRPMDVDGKVLLNPLLHALLCNALVADARLESLLTRARFRFLERAADPTMHGELAADELAFSRALARQCFINGYVYPVTPEERTLLATLLGHPVATDITPNQRMLERVAAIASYIPLHSLAGAKALATAAWPPAFQPLIDQQILEPLHEREDRTAIPTLTSINDDVSVKVRQQYEEHPYPRWTSLPDYAVREALVAFLQRRVASMAPMTFPATRGVRALNAGCGTGQHPIDMALRIADLQLLAIDLSLTSLAYARRKARDMGIENIEFAQADILQMHTYPERFDLIESTGVLHHLRDPEAGLSVLAGLLADHGLMRIALYSEKGRRDVVAARAHIAAMGYGTTEDDIRRCRQDLLELPDDDPRKPVTRLTDFYAMSGCRDLLFHVQEQRFSLSMVSRLLAAHALELAGIEIAPHVRMAFRERFPDEASILDLEKWAAFEHTYPDTFSGMYVFWVRKAKR